VQSQDQLKRQIGLRTAAALIVGETIAVGIFLTPSGMAKSLGSPLWLLVVWLLMGGMALCGALCYGELAARFPEAGGGYVYLREAFGAPVAFLYGWMALLVMDPGLTAALAVGLASYVGFMYPLSPVALKIVAIVAIFVVAAINIRGVQLGGSFVRWLTVTKLGLLAVLVLWGFVFQLGSWSNFTPLMTQRAGSEPLIGALAGGLVGAFFSFGGWWDLSKLAGEVRDPERTLPRALVYGVAMVTLVYILTSATFIYLVPLERVTSGETFAGQVGDVLFGPLGGRLFSFIVIVSVLGSLAAVVMSAPRVYFAMARDGLFVAPVADIHSRFKTPARAIIIQAVLATLLVLVGTFNSIISYFVFTVVLFIGLTIVGLFILRRRGTVATSYRTPGYPATPIFFLVLILLMLFLLGGNKPKQALAGVIVVALGLPVYYLLFRGRRRPSVPLLDGEERVP
jgi:APA family basic amino acid/polyamine antiporter